MTKKPTIPPHESDEIKRQFWQHQGVQVAFIVALIAGSFILPKIPMLRGWEYKYTTAAVEIGKEDLPSNALRIKTIEESLNVAPTIDPRVLPYLQLNGPIPVAAWACTPMKVPGLCVRYLHKNNATLTMVISNTFKKTKNTKRPFTKSGWGGYLIINNTPPTVVAVAGPYDPEEIIPTLNFPPKPPKAELTPAQNK